LSSNKLKINISGGTAKFENIVQGNANIINEDTTGQINKPASPCKAFISYRRKDSADITGRIYDRLANELGKNNVFKDVYSVPLGVNFKEYVNEEISKANIVLVIIGSSWLEKRNAEPRIKEPNDLVRLEIEAAFQNDVPLIPILVSTASMPEEEALPDNLKQLVYINGIKIRPDPDFEHDINSLLAAIKKLVGS